MCPCPLRVFTNEIKVFTSNGEYIFSVSSIVGKLLLNSSLSTLVSSYRAMPIGWDISSNAYSTTTSSLSLQIKKANPYKNNLWPSLGFTWLFPLYFSPLKAFSTAFFMTTLEFVAPDTASTSILCSWIILSATISAGFPRPFLCSRISMFVTAPF